MADPLELILNQLLDATVFARKIGKRTESGHPGSLLFTSKNRTRTETDFFFKRFGKELIQSYAPVSSKSLGLPKGRFREVNSCFHVAMFSCLWRTGQSNRCLETALQTFSSLFLSGRCYDSGAKAITQRVIAPKHLTPFLTPLYPKRSRPGA